MMLLAKLLTRMDFEILICFFKLFTKKIYVRSLASFAQLHGYTSVLVSSILIALVSLSYIDTSLVIGQKDISTNCRSHLIGLKFTESVNNGNIGCVPAHTTE